MGTVYALIIAAAFTLLSVWYADQAHKSLETANSTITSLQVSLSQERANLEDERKNRTEYLEVINHAKLENDKLRACIADGSCVPRVRIKTDCPKLPVSGSAAGTETTEARLNEDAEQNYLRLVEEIKVFNAQYDLCLKTVYSWSESSKMVKRVQNF